MPYATEGCGRPEPLVPPESQSMEHSSAEYGTSGVGQMKSTRDRPVDTSNASTGEHASVTPDVAASVFVGGGEMGALMRSLDWSKTPLGPVETWPQSLRMMVRFLLANRFPLLLWWGPEYASI